MANKTFPHPVLSVQEPSSDSDYVGQIFKADCDLKMQSDNSAYVNLDCTLSEPSLLRLIAQDQAEYAFEVHCRKTYVRRFLSSTDRKFSGAFSKGVLHERVEIFPYIVCTGKIRGHSSATLHPEFGRDSRFAVDPGDVLATAPPKVYWVEPELAKEIGSVFELRPSDKIPKGAFDIGWDEQKVQILMRAEDAGKFKTLQHSARILPSFLASVCLIAVTETLKTMVLEQETHVEKKWYQVIRHKLDQEKMLPLSENSPFLKLAQELLSFPVGQIIADRTM